MNDQEKIKKLTSTLITLSNITKRTGVLSNATIVQRVRLIVGDTLSEIERDDGVSDQQRTQFFDYQSRDAQDAARAQREQFLKMNEETQK